MLLVAEATVVEAVSVAAVVTEITVRVAAALALVAPGELQRVERAPSEVAAAVAAAGVATTNHLAGVTAVVLQTTLLGGDLLAY